MEIETAPSGGVAGRRAQTELLATATRTGHSLSALIASWLGSFTDSSDTRQAYARDLREYLDWCTRRDLEPVTVRLPEVQMYAAELAATPNPRTGRPPAASTRARKLAAVSSFYTYLVRAGAIDANPARDAARPRYDRRHSPTASVSAEQAGAMLTGAGQYQHRTLGPQAAALVMALLIDLGVRVSELCNADLSDLGQREGTRVLTVRMKGGKVRIRPIPRGLHGVLDAYLQQRPDADTDALVITRDGRRVNRHQIYRLVQSTAGQAGVPMPQRITPHSMRHTFNTIARQHGAALEDRRDALGHSSAAITQLYDHVALSLSRDPAHLVAEATRTPPDSDDHSP
ncbi:integrase [Saccharopolyspora rhizosphaerae]|uniref:Integrase n=1 Tax=Saccharopolyspora rhizosphaerae TaxID=2492662 RepID=A0A426K573_9PSEU|nr:tyrosine-type recombinase/integrase [Saccharopolyspora rhizosphaerae]RRO20551.1 integrase [Saccharopolyspora rhizosphaerae]